jgi:hypothetical protein
VGGAQLPRHHLPLCSSAKLCLRRTMTPRTSTATTLVDSPTEGNLSTS